MVAFLLAGFALVFHEYQLVFGHNGNLFDNILEFVSGFEDMHSLDSEYFDEEVVYLYFVGIVFLSGRIRTTFRDLEVMGRLTG